MKLKEILIFISLIFLCACSGNEVYLNRGKLYNSYDICMLENSSKLMATLFNECRHKRELIEVEISIIPKRYIDKLGKIYFRSQNEEKKYILPLLFVNKEYNETVFNYSADDYLKLDDFWFKFYFWKYINSTSSAIREKNFDTIFHIFENEKNENLKSMILYSLFDYKEDDYNKIISNVFAEGSGFLAKMLCATILSDERERKEIRNFQEIINDQKFIENCKSFE
jgi:hypothetical protein